MSGVNASSTKEQTLGVVGTRLCGSDFVVYASHSSSHPRICIYVLFVRLLPFNRARGLTGDVIGDAVDAFDLVGDARADTG